MATPAYEGTATIGTTEWSLTTNTAGPDAQTAAGTYAVDLDLSTLAAGDLFELRLYEKTLSTSSQILHESWLLRSGSAPGHICPATMLIHGWDFTLVKISGTDRSISWSVRKAGA